MESIIIIGGDKRQSYLKEIFLQRGYICDHINSADNVDALNMIDKYNCIILPSPLSKDKEHIYSDNSSFSVKIKDVAYKLKDNQILLAGSVDRTLSAYFKENGIKFFDYFSQEDFVIYNAYLTAQGALKLLLNNTDEFIRSKKILVTGYGRVAKAVSETLNNSGTDTYVTARSKAQLEEASCRGLKTIEMHNLSSCIHLFDFIFNTVPSNIFTKDDISHFHGKYFELASAPFGVKKEYFSGQSGIFIDGGALPGKYLPYSSAKKIAETISEYIFERKGGD